MLNKRPLSCAFLILLLSSTLLWGLSLVLLLSARADVDWSLQVVDEKATLQGVSLAVDSAGNPHIVYSDRSDTGLIVMKYASLAGTSWNIQTVDNGSAGSLALDSADNPHIAYSGTSSELKYASWNGQNWEIQTVDPAPNRPKTSPGACTSLQYLALDANDRPFIVYDVNTDVKLATKETSGWTVQTVISNESVSLGNLVLDSRGYPRFLYILGDTFGSLMYASWNGSTWSTQTIDKVLSRGKFIALDSNDNPHITYISKNYNLSRPVTYAVWNGATWDFQTLNHDFGAGWLLDFSAPLVLDHQGTPHMAYLQVRVTGFPYYDGTVFYAISNQPVPIVILFALWTGLLALAVALAAIGILAFKKRRNLTLH
jgi:hypothetical protein